MIAPGVPARLPAQDGEVTGTRTMTRTMISTMTPTIAVTIAAFGYEHRSCQSQSLPELVIYATTLLFYVCTSTTEQ